MIKKDLVDYIHKNAKPRISLTKIEQVLDNAIQGLQIAVSGGKRVEIRGFLIMDSKLVPERIGRNPKTGDAVTVKSHRKIRVKLSPGFLQ